MKLPEKAKLHVKVLSPTQTLYNGMATVISAVNEVGPFDILEDHANFFTLLSEGQVVVNNGFRNFTFPITKGVMKVKNNIVTLFVDIEPAYLSVNSS